MESQYAKNKMETGVPVYIQDQTTTPVDYFFTMGIGETTLTADAVLDAKTITVASVSAISAGNILYVVHVTGDLATEKLYFGTVLSIDTLTVTLDTPINYAYESGDVVLSRTADMDVDGSSVAKIFTVRGSDDPGFEAELDITRILMEVECATGVDLSTFGDLTALTNGVVLRTRNGAQTNIFNAKTNGELANIAYDWSPLTATNPALGVDGFLWRYTFNGQDKHGVAVRLGKGESLEFVIQDNLTGLTKMRCIAAGHVVDPE